MASHCAESTMNPRNDPVHPPLRLSCADGWSVKADVMKQLLRKHVRPQGLGCDRAGLHIASLPSCHVLETPAGDVEGLIQRDIGVLVATIPFLTSRRAFSSSRPTRPSSSRGRTAR